MAEWIGINRRARRCYGFDEVALVPGSRTINPNEVDTAFIIAGVNSFDESPYLPPIILGNLKLNFPFMNVSETAFTTSRYNGSPAEPGSFVLSSTAIDFTVLGIILIR